MKPTEDDSDGDAVVLIEEQTRLAEWRQLEDNTKTDDFSSVTESALSQSPMSTQGNGPFVFDFGSMTPQGDVSIPNFSINDGGSPTFRKQTLSAVAISQKNQSKKTVQFIYPLVDDS